MEARTTSTTLTARLPILNPGEYDLWLMRIEQYFLMTDCFLWEVILNGNKVVKRTVGEVEQEYEPASAEEKQDRRNEMKARGTLNKEEIETISLDDLYNNLKIYEPELTGSSSTSQNLKNVAFVSSNSTNSNNNISTNEADNTTYGVSAAHTQSNPTSGDNLSDVVICAFLASQPNSPQLAREDLEQIDPDDLEEMDLQWEMAMLTIRARRFIKRTGRKLDVNGQRVRFDRSKVECYNCHKNGHFARECRAPRNQENKGRENSRRTVTVETPTKNDLVAQDGIGGYDWSYQAEEDHPTNYALMAYTSSRSSSNSSVQDFEVDSSSTNMCLESVEARLAHYKKNEAVFEESIIVLNLEVKLRDNALVENKKKLVKERDELKLTSKSLNNLLESDVIDKFKTGLGYNAASSTAASPAVESFVNSSEMLENQECNKSKSDKGYHTSANVKNNGDALEPKTLRKNSFRPHVIEDWNSDDDSKVIRPVWNNSSRVNHKKFANKITHLHPNRRFVPQSVLTRSGKINTAGASINTAVRPVNTAGSKTVVNHPRPISNAYKRGYSQVTKPFNKYSTNKNSIFNKKVNTVKVKDTTARDRAVVSENKGIGLILLRPQYAEFGKPKTVCNEVTMAMAQTLIKMKEEKAKEKGVETESVEKTKKEVQGDVQMERDAKVALRLQAKWDKELRRKKQLAAERAEAIRNKPPTKTQLRNLIMTYLKNMGGYKHNQRKMKVLLRIQGCMNHIKRRFKILQPMDSRKKLRIKDVTKEEAAEYEKEKKELRLSLKIIFDDDSEVDYEPLSKKFAIVNWEY
ncbi:ribonuclease H-like domain-containing protein [Tanacetum coccineum]